MKHAILYLSFLSSFVALPVHASEEGSSAKESIWERKPSLQRAIIRYIFPMFTGTAAVFSASRTHGAARDGCVVLGAVSAVKIMQHGWEDLQGKTEVTLDVDRLQAEVRDARINQIMLGAMLQENLEGKKLEFYEGGEQITSRQRLMLEAAKEHAAWEQTHATDAARLDDEIKFFPQLLRKK